MPLSKTSRRRPSITFLSLAMICRKSSGDISLGDGTLRVLKPQTDGAIDLGDATHAFNDMYITGDINIGQGATIVPNGTGLFIGSGTSDKIGFYGATPVVQASAYTPTNVSSDRSYNADSTSTAELADVLGTLIADLQAFGIIG